MRAQTLALLSATAMVATTPLTARADDGMSFAKIFPPLSIPELGAVVRQIPVTFPNTPVGRHVATKWAWNQYQLKNWVRWGWEPTPPPPGFGYNSSYLRWEVAPFPEGVTGYHFDEETYTWVAEKRPVVDTDLPMDAEEIDPGIGP